MKRIAIILASFLVAAGIADARKVTGCVHSGEEMLSGVNIGGLGTPIASLASLITIKFYMRWPGAKIGRFLGFFTVANVLSLAGLLLFALIY